MTSANIRVKAIGQALRPGRKENFFESFAMGRVDHLPIYKAVYGYTKNAFQTKLELPKALKHDLGISLTNSAIKILELVISANLTINKSNQLKQLLVEIEVHWSYLRIAFDLKAISRGKFAELSGSVARLLASRVGSLDRRE